MRWLKCWLAATLMVLLGVPVVPAHAADPGPYVALGDSYTSGALVPLPADGPLLCLRSTSNYPSIIARTLPAGTFGDASCSGASTTEMTTRQPFTGNPPQLDALGAGTRLVTLGLGLNDARFGLLIGQCPLRALLRPLGRQCRESFTVDGRDLLSEAVDEVAPKLAQVLQSVHQRSPRARVVVLGYPSIVPNDGRSCQPLVPLSADDLAYIDELVVKLNDVLAAQAAANDAEYADSYTTSIGHDICAPPTRQWVEGTVPFSVAYPYHPNAIGEQHLARTILDVLAAPRPAPVLDALAPSRARIRSGSRLRLTYALNRAATVTLVVRQAVSGRREGSRCRRFTAANRRRPSCERSAGVTRTVRADGDAGHNGFTLGTRGLTAPGRYRVTATATGDGRTGDPQVTYFRIAHRR